MEKLLISKEIPMFVNTLENSYSNICICGTGILSEGLYNYFKGNRNIYVWKIDETEKEYRFPGVTELVIFMNEEHYDPINVDGEHIYFINYESMILGNECMPFRDIYQNIIPKLKKNGVKVLIVKTPNLRQYKPKIPLYVSMAFFKIIQKYYPNRDKVLLKHYGQAELLDEFMNTKADKSKGYLRVFGNGIHINYDDGFRRVFSTKEITYDKPHIYLFGFCISANPMLPDDKTVGANLQNLVDDKYRVCSKGNDGASINLIMRGIRYRKDDIVVLFTSHHDSMPDKMQLDTLDLTNVYANVSRLWDHVADDALHCDEKITEVISQAIFSKVKNYYIDRCGVKEKCIFFGTNQRRAPIMDMYKDVQLKEYIRSLSQFYRGGVNGAIVMNCNPFTLGHRYLISTAASMVDNLYVFVVEEDRSLFCFEDRIEMVINGTKDIDNVIVLTSGRYMISASTLPGYFDKKHLGNIEVSAEQDLELFAAISTNLGISIRFAGSEPKDGFTRSYNEAMKEILPLYGIEFKEIQRIRLKNHTGNSQIISATKVRYLIKYGKLDELKKFVPDTTFNILKQKHYISNP